MTPAIKTALFPYHSDTLSLFQLLAAEPWAVLLDSGESDHPQARFDIISARPYATLLVNGGEVQFQRQGLPAQRCSDDPFTILERELRRHSSILPDSIPFAGGAMGYCGYDLNHLQREGLPELAIGFYDWSLIIDHQLEQVTLCSTMTQPNSESRWDGLITLFSTVSSPSPADFHLTGPIKEEMGREHYRTAFEKIQSYLRAGDCYQVNLTQRFSAPYRGDPWSAYQSIRNQQSAPFSTFMRLPNAQAILSLSPERFLHIKQQQVTTSPIKGTRPRGKSAEEDRQLIKSLTESAKDRAENLMIVDLLRNDLGQCCEYGSISVPELFAIESHPNVHHLVSTIRGKLKGKYSAVEMFRHAFPGGSITGAPKIRAMEIIAELESHPRSIYCGSIGYWGFDGSMDSNIAIRTAYCSANTIYFHAGGGIVSDSVLEEEYQELFDKAQFFFDYLPTSF